MTDQLPVPYRPPTTLDFTPVPRKRRCHNGWTPACQRAFIAALAETGSVTAACRAVGKTYATAYRLYNHPEGASFRAAWDHALSIGGQKLHDIAMERITQGVPSPVFYQGEQVGERRLFSNTLLVQMIKHHNGGYTNSPVGHRSRAAKERWAAENCPACRERREAAAAAQEAEGAEAQAKLIAAAEKLLDRYALKIAAERRHRKAGEVVAADFIIRQMTVMEILMEGCGMDAMLRAFWGLTVEEALKAQPTDFIRELDAIKGRVWAEAGDPPRPLRRLEPGARGSAMGGGPTIMARYKAQEAAQARIAAAQAEWEAAGSEAGWKAWMERK